jgi:hypothetical protein
MGVARGCPDFLLFDPTGRLHALELKREHGTLSEDRQAFQEWAIALAVFGAWGALRVKVGSGP